MKTCNTCLDSKPLGDFYTAFRNTGGFSNKCKECSKKAVREYKKNNKGYHRKSMLMKTYGITLEYFDFLLKEQGNCCAICGSKSSNNPLTDNFVVDHNHATGKIRGLLCSYCNLTLGNAKESIQRLQQCAQYLIEKGDYSNEQ